MHGLALQLSKASGVPFYKQLKDQISELIRTGKLAAGDPLPSIRELAADHLVSVITVKKAYEELEHEGLVASRQGRGTFVSEEAKAASRDQIKRGLSGDLGAVLTRALAAGLSRDDAARLCTQSLDRVFGRENKS